MKAHQFLSKARASKKRGGDAHTVHSPGPHQIEEILWIVLGNLDLEGSQVFGGYRGHVQRQIFCLDVW